MNNKDDFNNILAYIPLVNIFLYFSVEKKSEAFLKHLKQWISLFLIYLSIQIVIGITFVLLLLLPLLNLAYLWVIIYFWINANNGKYIKIELIDKVSDLIFKK